MGQGWFEDDDAYQARMTREANESRIAAASGETPSQGWFESDESYASRISHEANMAGLADSDESTGQGWFEGDSAYRDRIAAAAHSRAIEQGSGERPSQGWFESDESYAHRLRHESQLTNVKGGDPGAASQGWFEGDEAYRRRISLRARELDAAGRAGRSGGGAAASGGGYSGAASYSGSGSRNAGFGRLIVIGLVLLAGWRLVELDGWGVTRIFRDRSGDAEYARIAALLEGKSISRKVRVPDAMHRATLTLASDREHLSLTSVMGTTRCAFELSPDGLEGDLVKLDREMTSGECKEFKVALAQAGKVLRLELKLTDDSPPWNVEFPVPAPTSP